MQFKTRAIVLRRINYGEADRILTLLTVSHGRLSAIAKGVRLPKSKLAGGIELFAQCDLTVLLGRGEMGTVTSSRIYKFYGNILKDYERTETAYGMLKGIYGATQTVSGPEFYDSLHQGLEFLDRPSNDWRLAKIWFILRLQSLLGAPLNLRADASGQPLEQGLCYNFDFSENAFYPAPKGRFGAAHLKLLRLCSAGRPDILAKIKGTGEAVGDCMWLAEAFEGG